MLTAESLRPEHFGHARTEAVGIADAPLPRQANEPPGDSGGSLYAPHVKIYPKQAHGRFRTAKWIVMAATLGVALTLFLFLGTFLEFAYRALRLVALEYP